MNKDLVSSIITMLFAIFYLAASWQYDRGSLTSPGLGFFPMITGAAFLICSLFFFATTLKGRMLSGKNENGLGPIPNIRAFAASVALVVVFLLVVEYVGFLVAGTLLTLALMWLMGGRTWLLNVTLAVGLNLGLYWLFWVVMRVPIPLGSLWGK